MIQIHVYSPYSNCTYKINNAFEITMSVNHQWRYDEDLLWYNDIVDRRANILFIIDLGKPGRCDHFLNMREIETEHYVATAVL